MLQNGAQCNMNNGQLVYTFQNAVVPTMISLQITSIETVEVIAYDESQTTLFNWVCERCFIQISKSMALNAH